MRGTQIKQADEVRVFAHDAVAVTPNDSVDISGTENRGVCIYVGSIAGGSDIKVTKLHLKVLLLVLFYLY
jgi:uncharacterized protein (DUF2345 family)